MTNELLFRLLTVLFVVIGFGMSGYFRRKADREGEPLQKGGRRLLIVLRLVVLIAIVPLLLYLVNPDWVAWGRLTFPLWLRWLGVVLATLTMPLIYWVLSTIGNNISPTQATREKHRLVTDGPYRYVRHPLYTVGLTFWLALLLITAVWPIIVGLGIGFTLIMWRTPQEEANLIKEFGDEYRRYMEETGRYLPRFR